jgi:aspartate racemase
MTIKVEYKGYDLFFAGLPTPAQIQHAYESLRDKALARIRKAEYVAIQPTARDAELPLSFAQESLWLEDQFAPGKATYNLPVAVSLKGLLNVEALEESFNEILRRHEILRTTFPEVDGRPVQVVVAPARLRLPVVDLGLLPPAEREAEAQRIGVEEARQSFDLSRGPMMRAGLLRLDAQEHVLLLTFHHIVYDAWSAGVFVREIAALYEALSQGWSSPLAELPIQYADYAHWQRGWLKGEVLESMLRYWKQQLAGAPLLLKLPTDRPRPTAPSFRGGRQHFTLPGRLVEQLKALSRQEGVTLFMTLMAAFQILLARAAGQTDICVGVPIAGRNRVETEGLIGCFINTLVIRTQVTGNTKFIELLRGVRDTMLGAYAHQELPFEKVIEALQPERHATYMPYYQVMFDLANAPSMQAVELPHLTLSTTSADIGAAKMDMVVDLWESGDQAIGHVEYKADLFDPETIARLLGHFETLLQSIVDRPDARVSSLEMLTEAEKQNRLAEEQERAAEARRRLNNARPKALKLPAEMRP